MSGDELRQAVRQRAGNRCEYCGLHQQYSPLVFQIEHIIARQHGGSDDFVNLALACDRCNLYKGTNLTAIDPLTQEIVRLFDPRRQIWTEHFGTKHAAVFGLTATGRATVRLLNLNHPRRLRLRAALLDQGESVF